MSENSEKFAKSLPKVRIKVRKKHRQKNLRLIGKLWELRTVIDNNNSGTFERVEIMSLLESSSFKNIMRILELEQRDIMRVFDMLDISKDGRGDMHALAVASYFDDILSYICGMKGEVALGSK